MPATPNPYAPPRAEAGARSADTLEFPEEAYGMIALAFTVTMMLMVVAGLILGLS